MQATLDAATLARCDSAPAAFLMKYVAGGFFITCAHTHTQHTRFMGVRTELQGASSCKLAAQRGKEAHAGGARTKVKLLSL